MRTALQGTQGDVRLTSLHARLAAAADRLDLPRSALLCCQKELDVDLDGSVLCSYEACLQGLSVSSHAVSPFPGALCV